MKIGIANDHTGVSLKNELVKYLNEQGYEMVNYGTDSTAAYDYPLAGETLALAVRNKEVDLGIAICGTGVGISIACNKVNGIRCCVCSEPLSAKMSRRHNNSNIIAFGARIVGSEMAKAIVDAWLNAEFEGGRHERRVAILQQIEDKQR